MLPYPGVKTSGRSKEYAKDRGKKNLKGKIVNIQGSVRHICSHEEREGYSIHREKGLEKGK